MPIFNPSMPSVPDGLHVDELKLDAVGLLITARTTAAEATCSACGRTSMRVHSTYWRTFKDLPWQDRAVTWRVKVRRFRCSCCSDRTFAERVLGFAGAKSRRSDRLAAAQCDIGLVLGGEAGARLSRRLAMPVSGDTVLRLVRRRGIAPGPPLPVVGIDDWAWRRGRSYGTIVCDLERRRVIDLLPGRSAEPLRDWLAAHPSVRVITRDRSGPYAEAARTGAPAAIQVADRWHLLVNASEALRGIVERHQPEIRRAARVRLRPSCLRHPAPPRRRPRPSKAATGKYAARRRCASTLKACPSGSSPTTSARRATPCAAGCGPAASSPTAARRVRAGSTSTGPWLRRSGGTASDPPPRFTASYARSASPAATTSSGTGGRDSGGASRRGRPRAGSRPHAASRAG